VEIWNVQMSRLSTERTSETVIRPIVIKKHLNIASLPLYVRMLRGELIPKAILAMTTKSGEQGSIEIFRLELFDVPATYESTTPSAEDTNTQTEEIAPSFGKICSQ
jgi:type VI protein secretion system component Hcp